jgi:hypothetical protein
LTGEEPAARTPPSFSARNAVKSLLNLMNQHSGKYEWSSPWCRPIDPLRRPEDVGRELRARADEQGALQTVLAPHQLVHGREGPPEQLTIPGAVARRQEESHFRVARAGVERTHYADLSSVRGLLCDCPIQPSSSSHTAAATTEVPSAGGGLAPAQAWDVRGQVRALFHHEWLWYRTHQHDWTPAGPAKWAPRAQGLGSRGSRPGSCRPAGG